MKTASSLPVNQATFGALAGGVTLMRANFSDLTFERHSHDGFAVGATTYGIQRFRCKGRQYDSRPGDLVLFNPDDDHDGCRGTADGFRYTMWYVPDDFMAGCAPGNRYFSRPHATDPQLADAFQALCASLVRTQGEALRTESLLRAFLGKMLARHGARPQPDARPAHAGGAALARVRDSIRTYYAHDITVADLAAVAGLSRAHLTRAFAHAYHMPPHVYLNAVRIAQAQARIRLGMPLADVALACGYADQSHFTRRFKGSVGVTPSAWRSMNSVSGPVAAAP